MTAREAFLAAIVASPGEDTAKLAYADWLDENATSDADRQQAEFIRQQFPPDPLTRRHRRVWERYAASLLRGLMPSSWRPWLVDTPGSPVQLEREESLLRQGIGTGRSWAARWGATYLSGFRQHVVVALRHGFVAHLALPWRAFQKTAAGIFSTQPIEEIAISSTHPAFTWDLGPGLLPRTLSHESRVWLRGKKARRYGGWTLAPELFDRLQGGTALGHDERWRAYPTLAAAHEAVGAAALDIARRLAAMKHGTAADTGTATL